MSTDLSGNGKTTYKANGFHLASGNKTLTGRLIVAPQGIQFQSEATSVELPFDGLTIHRGGHNNSQIFFQHPARPGWSVYTPDEGVLTEYLLNQTPSLSHQVQALKKRSRTGVSAVAITLVAMLAIFISLVVLLVTQKGRIVRYIAEKIPVEWEVKFGDAVFQQLSAHQTTVTNTVFQTQLESVTSRLLIAAVTNSNYAFRFHIIQDTNINAYAIPGGHIVVNTGLLKAVNKPEELAGVIAHEMAHVTERHGFRKIIETTGLFLLVQALLGDATGLLAVIADSSEYLLRQKYSRDFEREADDVGWNYLIAANIDPRGMITFFRTLQHETEQSSNAQMESSLNFLSTHPATAERIQRLEEKWEKLQQKSGFIEISISYSPKALK